MASGTGSGLPYVCPAGVDCSFLNSVPSQPVPCPRGWLCSGYSGHPQQAQLDATATNARLGYEPSTVDRFDGTLSVNDPGRWWEGPCPTGFYCPSATRVTQCPQGHWCPDGAMAPLQCDWLSYCPAGSRYQLSFAAPLLALLYTCLILLWSGLLRHSQKRGERRSRRQEEAVIGDATAVVEKAGAIIGQHHEPRTSGHTHRSALSLPGHDPQPVTLKNLQVKANGVTVLRAATIQYPQCRLTAILGPSGCGKTTLLHALQRTPAVWAVHAPLALVPQVDVIDPFLTVKELLAYRVLNMESLHFSGALPPRGSTARARATVDAVVHELRLGHVANVRIGGSVGEDDSASNGSVPKGRVSGGQLKRVSIGLDLLEALRSSAGAGPAVTGTRPRPGPALPQTTAGGQQVRAGMQSSAVQAGWPNSTARTPLLMLDEPTSGLDASASWSLAVTLQRVSRKGVTVIAALHQPRKEAWQAIDHVILMAPVYHHGRDHHTDAQGPDGSTTGHGEVHTAAGQHAGTAGTGAVVYCGPRSLAVPYFLSLGVGYENVPPHPLVCEADWLLDVVTGMIQPPPLPQPQTRPQTRLELREQTQEAVDAGEAGVHQDQGATGVPVSATAIDDPYGAFALSCVHRPPVDLAGLWASRGEKLLQELQAAVAAAHDADNCVSNGSAGGNHDSDGTAGPSSQQTDASGAIAPGQTHGGLTTADTDGLPAVPAELVQEVTEASAGSYDALVPHNRAGSDGVHSGGVQTGVGPSGVRAAESTGNRSSIHHRKPSASVIDVISRARSPRGHGQSYAHRPGRCGLRMARSLRACRTAARPACSRWLWQAGLQVHRTVLVRLRDSSSLRVQATVNILMSCVLAVGFSIFLQGAYTTTMAPPVEQELQPFLPPIIRDRAGENSWDVPLQQLLFFLPMMAGSAAGLSSIGLFGARVPLLKREASTGLSSTAMAVGSMTAELVLLLWGALLYTGVWMLFAPPGPWYWWLGVVAGTGWAASGVAYIVSLLTRPTNAAVIATLLYTVSSVLSGVEPHLATVRRLGPNGSSVGLEVVWYLSYATWAGEGAYACWSEHFTRAGGPRVATLGRPYYDRVQAGADVFGYEVASPRRAIAALFALGVLWRIVATAALAWLVHRDATGGGLQVRMLPVAPVHVEGPVSDGSAGSSDRAVGRLDRKAHPEGTADGPGRTAGAGPTAADSVDIPAKRPLPVDARPRWLVSKLAVEAGQHSPGARPTGRHRDNESAHGGDVNGQDDHAHRTIRPPPLPERPLDRTAVGMGIVERGPGASQSPAGHHTAGGPADLIRPQGYDSSSDHHQASSPAPALTPAAVSVTGDPGPLQLAVGLPEDSDHEVGSGSDTHGGGVPAQGSLVSHWP